MGMIDGSTKKTGVMGWPVSHTLSPHMHNAAFTAIGLNYIYAPFAVRPEELEAAVKGLKALDFSGMNVTIPHKVNIMQYLDEIEADAREIGAVNTIIVREGKLIGANTDAKGFTSALLAEKVNPQGKTALLLGAGGAARAVVCGLATQGVKAITVAARSKEKAKAFAESFPSFRDITAVAFDETEYEQALKRSNLVINCTPIGMKPDEMPPLYWPLLPPDAAICDLVYTPLVTPLLNEAKLRGHQVVGGLGMLVEQGAVAFEKWTGQPAPRDVMMQAAIARLVDKS